MAWPEVLLEDREVGWGESYLLILTLKPKLKKGKNLVQESFSLLFPAFPDKKWWKNKRAGGGTGGYKNDKKDRDGEGVLDGDVKKLKTLLDKWRGMW